jgi:hypothetical protein
MTDFKLPIYPRYGRELHAVVAVPSNPARSLWVRARTLVSGYDRGGARPVVGHPPIYTESG